MGCLLPFWGASDPYESTSRVVFSSRSPAHVGFAANHSANTNLNLPLFMERCLCIRVCLHQMRKWRVKTTRWDHFRTKIFAFFVQLGSPSPTFPFSSGIQMLFTFAFPGKGCFSWTRGKKIGRKLRAEGFTIFLGRIQLLFVSNFSSRDGKEYILHGQVTENLTKITCRWPACPFSSSAFKYCSFSIFHLGMKFFLFSMDEWGTLPSPKGITHIFICNGRETKSHQPP